MQVHWRRVLLARFRFWTKARCYPQPHRFVVRILPLMSLLWVCRFEGEIETEVGRGPRGGVGISPALNAPPVLIPSTHSVARGFSLRCVYPSIVSDGVWLKHLSCVCSECVPLLSKHRAYTNTASYRRCSRYCPGRARIATCNQRCMVAERG